MKQHHVIYSYVHHFPVVCATYLTQIFQHAPDRSVRVYNLSCGCSSTGCCSDIVVRPTVETIRREFVSKEARVLTLRTFYPLPCVCSTRAQHDKRSKAESPKLKAPDTDTSPPVQEVLSVESERTKVIMVPNTAYNFFRSNSYVFHAESVGLQTLTLERKQAKPKLSQSQPAEDRGEPLKLPPRIKRVSVSVDDTNSYS